MDKLKVFLHNLKSVHHRTMMRYLRKRGWVVFYLEPRSRICDGVCWLKLYEAEQFSQRSPARQRKGMKMSSKGLDGLMCQMLDKGFAITIYNNALGTITGKTHSVDEIVIENDDPADNWKNKPNQRSVVLEGEIIVEGKSLFEVINSLSTKAQQ